jgi:hypothetical protein
MDVSYLKCGWHWGIGVFRATASIHDGPGSRKPVGFDNAPGTQSPPDTAAWGNVKRPRVHPGGQPNLALQGNGIAIGKTLKAGLHLGANRIPH